MLLVNLQRRLNPRMSHQCLRILRVSPLFLQPCGIRGPQTSPVDKWKAELPARRFYMPNEDVVIPHRCRLHHGLEHEIVIPIGFYSSVAPQCPPRLHFNRHHFEPENPFNNSTVDRNRSVAGFALGGAPITTAVT